MKLELPGILSAALRESVLRMKSAQEVRAGRWRKRDEEGGVTHTHTHTHPLWSQVLHPLKPATPFSLFWQVS